MSNYILYSYNTLNAVYREGAYAGIVLAEILPTLEQGDKALVTRIVYGAIEHHEEFSYMLEKLCIKAPKAVIKVIIRLGMYIIKYMDSIPDYAAVNEVVELTKTVGKKELAPFVNSLLKKFIAEKDNLPSGIQRICIDNNIPMWLANRYIKDYGYNMAVELIGSKGSMLTHIRNNNRLITTENLENILKKRNIDYKTTQCGFLIGSTDSIGDVLDSGKATVQALCSMLVCRALTPDAIRGKILDVCAAPGGKSIYLSELNPNASILALDIHAHRVELIKAYSSRMSAYNVTAEIYDSTYCNSEWMKRFDAVLVDAPCSGMGVRGSNPDIVLNKKESDIEALAKLQLQLLSAASKYVKAGGALVYSTCTNIKQENVGVVTAFLSENLDFVLDGMNISEENNG
ncbi:MAG: 16S rRNA (cytosine(967)-C(5))-methyltransferase RsmB, partial [Clostridia bacterium]|nr:16S rRNA (cytosine(967)-C(5))-methyltransferase RsmB [Clostridia bacterium]